MKNTLTATIVAYNNYDDIKKAIYSIENNTSLSKHIYIVDNSASSCDKNLIEDFKEYIDQFNDVTYLKTEKNLGYGGGHNVVLPIIDSKYHAIVNPDITLEGDSFGKIVSYMDENNDVGMVIPNIIAEDGERQLVYRKELTVFDMFIRMFCKNLFKKRQKLHTLQYEDYSKPFNVPFGQGSFLVIRTELFKEIKGFDDNYFMYVEDADLCKRVNQISKLMYFPDATVVHKWERKTGKNKTHFKYHFDSMRYYFKKWGIKLF